MTMTGTSSAATDGVATLQHDVLCILMQFHRQHGLQSLRFDATPEELKADSAEISRALSPLIGGRYVPTRDVRAETNAAIVAMFDGKNRDAVMRHFKISRRTFYRVIAEDLKTRQRQGQK
jgi:Mor family transcriptional regulator